MSVPPTVVHGLLAFDTSTEQLAVALACGPQTARRRLTRQLPGGAAASAALLPALRDLLDEAGLVLADVAAIAFGQGPGAFTGLRTSCAVAQGLAFGLGRPVLPVDSLLIVAEQARRARAPQAPTFEVGVAMDARMGEIYAARYRWHDADWQLVQPPALRGPSVLDDDWAADMPPHAAGNALGVHAKALQRGCPPARWVATGDDRAAALLMLAERAWVQGRGVDAAEALPLYLRDKVAFTSAERARARDAGVAG